MNSKNYNRNEAEAIIREKMKVFITLDGLGKKAKEKAFGEILILHKLMIMKELSTGFGQGAFYGNDAEAGSAGILIDKQADYEYPENS